MGARQLIILAVALVAAIGLAMLVGITMHHPAAPKAIAETAPRLTVQVLVAKRDLPVGTRLAAGDLAWQAWPADALNSSFITDGHGDQAAPTTPVATVETQATKVAAAAATSMAGGGPMEALYGAMVHEAILTNEPIVNTKLLRSGEGGYMAVVLQPGMRAVSIPITANTTAGGFVLPGDHVDVLQAHQAEGPATGGRTGFTVAELLRNVRVLAIDQSVQATKGSESLVGAVATLEVSPNDVKVLTLAKAQGEIMLSLRPFGDASEPPTQRADISGAVRIIRAGQVSEVMVAQ